MSAEDIAYLERMMAQMNVTAEQEAAFRLALYGDSGPANLPKAFALSQNYPNPFNPSTTINFDVPESSTVHLKLTVYNIRGQLVRTLVDEVREPGTYGLFWDGTSETGRRLASGIYLYRLQAGDFVQIRKNGFIEIADFHIPRIVVPLRFFYSPGSGMIEEHELFDKRLIEWVSNH